MKILTKDVIIGTRHFYLISDYSDNKKYYATIPYEYVQDGRLTKQLNGATMCATFESPAEAIQCRINRCKVEEFEATGKTQVEVLAFIANGYKVDDMYETYLDRLKSAQVI